MFSRHLLTAALLAVVTEANLSKVENSANSDMNGIFTGEYSNYTLETFDAGDYLIFHIVNPEIEAMDSVILLDQGAAEKASKYFKKNEHPIFT